MKNFWLLEMKGREKMPKQVFMDYASCTPVNSEVYNTYCKLVKDYYVNSEAVYFAGNEVHNLVEKSRQQIAKLLHVDSDELLFTSGASEANSFAIKGFALKNMHKGKHIITSAMEHSSVLHSVEQLENEFGFEVTWLPVNKKGTIDYEQLQAALRPDTILVSLMSVNNEIGSIQDIERISKIVHSSSRAKLHVDAVQSIGKMDMDFQYVDMLTFTAHKLYGIKGCGILYRKKNIELLPLISGGQQEFGLRGGTLNAPSCIVFAKTLRLALENQQKHYEYVKQLNLYAREKLLEIEDIVINSPEDACPYILNISCVSIGSEIMMNALNAKRICVSTQSTCSSRTKAPSHTLTAMGLDPSITYGAIRMSFSHLTTLEEIDYVMQNLKEIIHEFRTK